MNEGAANATNRLNIAMVARSSIAVNPLLAGTGFVGTARKDCGNLTGFKNKIHSP